MKRLFCIIWATFGMTLMASAQSDDFGMYYELGAEKKLNKKWSVGLEGEFRTRNNTKTADRWSAGVNAEYKIVKGLKASAGYNFLYDNNAEQLTWKNELPNKWTPSYWGVRHRFNLQLQGSVALGNFNLSLRERWQYTYRPEKTVERWDFDNAHWEDKVRSGKGKHQLRSRLQVSYDKKRGTVEPYASIELYNSWSIEKIRYTIGADWKLSKQHILGAYYLFQKRHNADTEMDDDEPDMHWLGIAYKFKF